MSNVVLYSLLVIACVVTVVWYNIAHGRSCRIQIISLLSGGNELFGLDLVQKSDGKLKRGTVYVFLRGLEDDGFVSSRVSSRTDPQTGIPRRLYYITRAGRRHLASIHYASDLRSRS